jgi:hypothetical protein
VQPIFWEHRVRLDILIIGLGMKVKMSSPTPTRTLRIGLCSLVDRKELTIEQATRIFEEQRTATVRRMQMDGGGGKLEI